MSLATAIVHTSVCYGDYWMFVRIWQSMNVCYYYTVNINTIPNISFCGSQLDRYMSFGFPGKVLASHFQMTLCGNSDKAPMMVSSLSWGVVVARNIDPKLM